MSKKEQLMPRGQSVIWAGDDASLDLFMSADLKVAQLQAGGVVLPASSSSQSGEDDQSYLLSVQDGVGIIQVHGTLTPTEKWYNQYIGLVSYEQIRLALYQAVTDPSVSEILLDVSSPGGSIMGLMDAAEVVARAAKTKRLTAYTDSVMHSGGYWLSVPAKQIFASPLASVGSIGCVARHFEYSKQLADEGVGVTVVRSGPYKHVPSEVEPLSKTGLEIIQTQVDAVNDIFVEFVAEHLGTTPAVVEKTMGQGRTFMGAKAVEAGLATGVASFDEVFSAIQKRVANAGATPQGGTDMKKKYALPEATALAAAASGMDLSEVEAPPTDPGVVTPPTEPEAAAPPVTTEEGVTTEAPAATTTEASSAVVDLLKSQLKEKDEELFNTKSQVAALTVATEGLDQLKMIVAGHINQLNVSMNGSVDPSLETASVQSLITAHSSAKDRFTTWWSGVKAGGTAVTTEQQGEVKPTTPVVSRQEAARITSAQVK